MSRRLAIPALALHVRALVIALSTAMLTCTTAYAANFGHSRIVSNPGQPLGIDVPITQLNADDLRSLVVRPASTLAWNQAGLTPPVPLNTMQVRVVDGFRPDAKVIQVRSTQAFSGPVADLLLNVSTASGQQQYQVSIVAPTPSGAFGATGAVQAGAAAPGAHSRAKRAQGAIRIRHGDTLWAIARRHAVPGVSIFQMMVALQRANPQAFIHQNLNLIKAGATLTIPDRAALTAVSDREARRIFEQQLHDFMKYRQGVASRGANLVRGEAANKGQVLPSTPSAAPVQPEGPRDQLKLSTARSAADKAADDRVATEKGIAESQARVSTLEGNVKDLNQALQSQGRAASDALIGGAKG
ncbi:MAG TPA: FimV/HubP family polar landmark protein, partial [Paralcaligenes sp.]